MSEPSLMQAGFWVSGIRRSKRLSFGVNGRVYLDSGPCRQLLGKSPADSIKRGRRLDGPVNRQADCKSLRAAKEGEQAGFVESAESFEHERRKPQRIRQGSF